VTEYERIEGSPFNGLTDTQAVISGLEPETEYTYIVALPSGLLSEPIKVTTKEGCQATITILSNDENFGTVEFIE